MPDVIMCPECQEEDCVVAFVDGYQDLSASRPITATFSFDTDGDLIDHLDTDEDVGDVSVDDVVDEHFEGASHYECTECGHNSYNYLAFVHYKEPGDGTLKDDPKPTDTLSKIVADTSDGFDIGDIKQKLGGN